MLNELIERTNKKEFYNTGRIHLTHLKGQIENFKTVELNIIVDEQNEFGDRSNIEHWHLIAHQTIDFNGIFADLYLPYIKLKVLDDHPLLWTYQKDELICELSGFPRNNSEFLGDLFYAYENATGNWIPLHNHFWNVQNNDKRDIAIQEPLSETIQSVCEKHGIKFRVTDITEGADKGYAFRPEAKLLIFGNEDVCPNNFNLGQPYIIAEKFIASRK